MLIPPQNIQKNLRTDNVVSSKLRLKTSHLIIDKEVATLLFEDEPNVNIIYYAQRNALMIAPASDELFKKLHRAKQHMLKDKNGEGDKSIALHELLIDNELDDTDRDIEYEIQTELKVLNVKL